MEINVLAFGDVVGKPGRETLAALLPELKEQYQADLVIVNAENATHGRGLMAEHAEWFKALGVDVITSGDHIWRFPDIRPILDRGDTWVVRPADYPNAPGKGYVDVTVKGKRVRVISLIGRVFLEDQSDNPFLALDRILSEGPEPDAVIVDFHAEATSEKRCLAEHTNGRAQLVFGTHTHVPTADAQILPSGTAYQTDLGMVGPSQSALGAEKGEVIQHFLTGLPWRYSVGTGQCELGATFCRISLDNKRAVQIEAIRRLYEPEES